MTQELPGDYIAGFVDGEGCFYLTYRSEKKTKRPGQPIYRRWLAYFAIKSKMNREYKNKQNDAQCRFHDVL